jgi:CBS domain-containing protein
MRVRDVMTVGVIAASSTTRLKEVASLLVGAKVSGLPVVDEGKLVGIVTESDLMPLHEGTPGHPVQIAADVMTRKVVTLVEEMTVTSAARVLERHRVKRAPVMRGDRMVGIVSRGDLLRPYLRTDLEIRAEVEELILAGSLGVRAGEVQVLVEDGVVQLDGEVESERLRAIVSRLVRSVDGVVDVVDNVTVAGQTRVGPAVA